MTHDPDWRRLLHTDDRDLAHRVVTTLDAMGFESQVRDGGRLAFRDADGGEPSGPYEVDVPAADWADLNDVLAEVIDEQHEFDARLERRDQLVGRMQRGFIVLMTLLILTLVAIGALRL